ncbi:16S rRNA (cytosine(967)-C(5))-methyltransferase RsmB [Spartinivicinus poritis]|uniref:16S rRNA (cytosine(967)-C(5))-methyltransferase n=1 Tax=Spartinivicinus poritis TaxID=2994640 RepID=A0ABT5UBW0_9GAMM|nr:16S rRNA (cytosine(967)-C(5))-methyltransferase RsmB [Spartinivicinus sp. A2-2]MDE1463817.1 16S rRNA (cytosine(967)-C(5))-methyltransferase RsmB [Spartinivicinus sp. A2-2]
MSDHQPVRMVAAKAIKEVINQGQSLSQILPQFSQQVAPRDRSLLQELCYGTLRWYFRLSSCSKQLLSKPLKSKDADIFALILLGLYQLVYTRIPAHAAIGETVGACQLLKKNWAKGLVNGVLRQFQRQQQQLLEQADQTPETLTSHPDWLRELLIHHWPDHWPQIIEANNSHPPMTLRVNLSKITRDDFLSQCNEAGIEATPCQFAKSAVTLKQPVPVLKIPGFSEGLVSVQDEAAQLSATLLDLQPGQRVLDACAAPGGKTCHIIETQPELAEVIALDVDGQRLGKVKENLHRLDLNCQVVEGDASKPLSWWDGREFDRILLDAPCSATGVIRRHPDIKLLRRPDDIDNLAVTQQSILTALWQLLKPGGRLVYATCSVIPEENAEVVLDFLENQADAALSPIDTNWGIDTGTGRQLLPQINGHDGFFYACLLKT